MKYDCLIIDDEKELNDNTAVYFNMFDVKTASVYSSAQAEEFLRTNHAEEWYDNKGRAGVILDGLGFTISLKLDGGKGVEAIGSMSRPKGCSDEPGGMESLFLDLWEASGREAPGA